jgi:glutamine amidotransferase
MRWPAGKPVLGICIGCQVVMDASEEDDAGRCLGFLIPGLRWRFPLDFRDKDGQHLKVPHMGWNQVKFIKSHPVLKDLPEGAEFYFVHSYYPLPQR